MVILWCYSFNEKNETLWLQVEGEQSSWWPIFLYESLYTLNPVLMSQSLISAPVQSQIS